MIMILSFDRSANVKCPVKNWLLEAVRNGDNWFYYGRYGYSQGTGLGTLDVANFAAYLRGLTP